ncbi:MAG TPA: hypothetical protein VNQ57_07395 [Ureibacillus sp.]|nr:hypothetical protein [Ureibacillus sp.]
MARIISSLFILLFITGCDYSKPQETIVQNSSEMVPPKVKIEIEDTVHSTEQATYCWRNDNSAECLNLPTAIEILENTKPIEVSSKETITLVIKRQPSEQTITIQNTESNEIDEITIKNSKFKAPTAKGIYILNYYAIWEKDETKTSGDSSYVFKIEVK